MKVSDSVRIRDREILLAAESGRIGRIRVIEHINAYKAKISRILQSKSIIKAELNPN